MWKPYVLQNMPYEAQTWCVNKGIHPLVSPLFSRVGLLDIPQMNEFLYKRLDDTRPSTLFGPNMEKAVKRLLHAVNNGEHIVVFGDYDVDGTTGTSVVLTVLSHIQLTKKFTFSYMIPNRFTEGYGLNDNNIGRLMGMKPNLVITVDCGITSTDQVRELKKHGIDTIVTDHHNAKGDLPNDAVAIVHPATCGYPFQSICGCAVAYQFMKGIWETRGKAVPDWVKYGLLDLVALGTVCDIMPLVDDNRVYVKEGLRVMNSGSRYSIKALKTRFKWDKIDTITLGFFLGPMINAAGRIKDADTAVEFMLNTSPTECTNLANEMYQRNEERKSRQNYIVEEGLKQAEKQKYKNILVIKGKDFHGGIVGIAASKIMNKYYKPTFVLHENDKGYGGSARSIAGIDLFKEAQKHEHLLGKWGGHAAAMGMNVSKENADVFFSALDEELSKYPESVWNKISYYDGDISSPFNINEDFFRDLELFGPFGQAFPQPVWRVRGTLVEAQDRKKEQKTGQIDVGGQKYNFAMWSDGDKAFIDREQTYYGTWSKSDKYGVQFTAIDAEPPKRPTLSLRL